MTSDQATEMTNWLKALWLLQLGIGVVLIVALVAVVVVHFWRGG